MIQEMSQISLTQDDFVEVTNNNIEDLLREEEEKEGEEDYCEDENFNFSL